MSLFNEKTLDSVCDLIIDCEHKTAPIQATGYPSIRTPNIGRGRLILEPVNRVSEETYLAWTRRATPQADDLILAREAPAGNVAIIPKNVKVCLGQRTVLLRPDKKQIDPDYLLYLLLEDTMQARLLSYGSGATVPHVNMSDIRALQLPILPPLPIQRRIASILSAYDDLIENNTRRIAILEEMARRIYEEWFVKFKFPGHEKVKMVDSELGKIPEGWELKKLSDVLTKLESGTRPKGGIDPNERGVPSIGAENINGLGQYDYNKEKFVSRNFFDSMRRGKIQSGDVLLYKDGAHIGRKTLFQDNFPHKECAINEHVFILRADENISQSYLYFWLDQHEMTSKIKSLNANAAQPGINQVGVNGLPILVPRKEILYEFNVVIEPLLGLLFTLAKKNRNLRTTRDFLLPKLISGEIDVSQLPEPEEAAA